VVRMVVFGFALFRPPPACSAVSAQCSYETNHKGTWPETKLMVTHVTQHPAAPEVDVTFQVTGLVRSPKPLPFPTALCPPLHHGLRACSFCHPIL
jgi:hypothetical protein